MVVLSVFTFCSCGSGSSNLENKKSDILAGNWELDNNTKYYFDGKGRGILTASASEYEFSYIIEDNNLLLDFVSSSAIDSAYEFNIENDNLKLISKDKNKGIYLLVRHE